MERHWQREPVVLRAALPEFRSPLTPGELAGLACEDDVESRLILERGGAEPWEVRHGPFAERDFTSLPDTHWTLLVQELDRHLDVAAELLDLFRFVPNWRIDDVMVSYAPREGSAGPHVDNYDVFLVQGLGRRRWAIEKRPREAPERTLPCAANVLREFEPDEEWVLEPGDVLYLPPRVPHHGVALDDCMTYSIGFRAPTRTDLVASFLDERLQRQDRTERLGDAGRRATSDPGLLEPAALRHARELLRALVRDDATLDRWFGRFVTEPRREATVQPPDRPMTADSVIRRLRGGEPVRRAAPSCFAYFPGPDGGAQLFVGGAEYALDAGRAALAPGVCGTAPPHEALLPWLEDGTAVELIVDLFNRGYLLFPP
ncbi:MAG: cupin domain-containing protein [bacterium]|nr:cupin domain-containing protein [bacterium]